MFLHCLSITCHICEKFLDSISPNYEIWIAKPLLDLLHIKAELAKVVGSPTEEE